MLRSLFLRLKQPPQSLMPDLKHGYDAPFLIDHKQNAPADVGFPRTELLVTCMAQTSPQQLRLILRIL